MKKLKKITLGKNVQQIGRKVFIGSKKLKKVVITSKKIKKIGKKAFYQTKKAIQFVVPSGKIPKYQKLIQKSIISNKFNVTRR